MAEQDLNAKVSEAAATRTEREAWLEEVQRGDRIGAVLRKKGVQAKIPERPPPVLNADGTVSYDGDESPTK